MVDITIDAVLLGQHGTDTLITGVGRVICSPVDRSDSDDPWSQTVDC